MAMIGVRPDIEGFEVGRAKKLRVNRERPDRLSVAIVAEFVELEMVGNRRHVRAVEQLCRSSMAIIIAALRLVGADA